MNVKVELPAVVTTGLGAMGLAAAGAAINPIAAGLPGVALLVAKVARDQRKGVRLYCQHRQFPIFFV
jgi:hypothetical protein